MARIHSKLYKKDLHDPDKYDGVITHLEPDILESEVRWALERITMNKGSGDDGIPAELYQVLKDDAVQCASKFGKLSSGRRTRKRSVFIPISKKGNAKGCSNYCTIALISHSSKVMLTILQERLQQYMNCEISGVQVGFRRGTGTRD